MGTGNTPKNVAASSNKMATAVTIPAVAKQANDNFVENLSTVTAEVKETIVDDASFKKSTEIITVVTRNDDNDTFVEVEMPDDIVNRTVKSKLVLVLLNVF